VAADQSFFEHNSIKLQTKTNFVKNDVFYVLVMFGCGKVDGLLLSIFLFIRI